MGSNLCHRHFLTHIHQSKDRLENTFTTSKRDLCPQNPLGIQMRERKSCRICEVLA